MAEQRYNEADERNSAYTEQKQEGAAQQNQQNDATIARKNWYNGVSLDGVVKGHLDIRKDSAWNSKWKQEKRPGMQLISNATIGGVDGMKITGDSDFWHREGMYEENSGQITARPTLESIKISTTGTAGTMRKAEITFKVYSFVQLRDAQLSFFIPGVSVTALWGWTITQDGTPVNTNPNLGIGEGKTSMSDIYEKLFLWSKEQAGCADGLIGVVSNFEWSRVADGGAASGTAIECQITLESPARAFLDQTTNPPTAKDCGCTEGSEDNDKAKDKAKGGHVKQALKDQAKATMNRLGSGTLWKPKDEILGVSFSFDQKYQNDEDKL